MEKVPKAKPKENFRTGKEKVPKEENVVEKEIVRLRVVSVPLTAILSFVTIATRKGMPKAVSKGRMGKLFRLQRNKQNKHLALTHLLFALIHTSPYFIMHLSCSFTHFQFQFRAVLALRKRNPRTIHDV